LTRSAEADPEVAGAPVGEEHDRSLEALVRRLVLVGDPPPLEPVKYLVGIRHAERRAYVAFETPRDH
jgi:hypothetical protein